ncbi:hypothetical protein GGS20DRAFT_591635 [Poronia punctata]|nr:hypothetical protein GGS20DRAFT_591635 [Poronia punctata]
MSSERGESLSVLDDLFERIRLDQIDFKDAFNQYAELRETILRDNKSLRESGAKASNMTEKLRWEAGQMRERLKWLHRAAEGKQLDNLEEAIKDNNQARFDDAMTYIVGKGPDHSLDFLRRMSEDHKTFLLNVERDYAEEKITKYKEDLRRSQQTSISLRQEMNQARWERDSEREEVARLKRELVDAPETIKEKDMNIDGARLTLIEKEDQIEAQVSRCNLLKSKLQTERRERLDKVRDMQNKIDQHLEAQVKAAEDLAEATETRDAIISRLETSLETEKKGREADRETIQRLKSELDSAREKAKHMAGELTISQNMILATNGNIAKLQDDEKIHQRTLESAQECLKLTEDEMEAVQKTVQDKDRKIVRLQTDSETEMKALIVAQGMVENLASTRDAAEEEIAATHQTV